LFTASWYSDASDAERTSDTSEIRKSLQALEIEDIGFFAGEYVLDTEEKEQVSFIIISMLSAVWAEIVADQIR